jgi:hypothetical protein
MVAVLAVARSLLVASALLVAGNASSATGPAPERVAVVEPELHGTFDRGAARQMAGRIRAGIDRSGVAVIDATHAEACADAACFARIAEGTRATHVVRAVVSEAERDYHLELELLDASGTTIASVEDTCEICGVEEAADMLEATATRLVAQLDAGTERASVRVQSRPAGASVSVDGKEMGTTPTTLELPPGQHTIELRKDGFAAASRTVELEPGMRTTSEMRLVPNAGSSSRRAKIVGGTLLGVGLASLVGGIVMVAVDGREYEKRCDGNDVDADGDCRFVYRLKWPGAAMIAAGAALAGVGITVLAIDRRRGKGSVRAAVTPSGLRVSGRF